MTEVFPRQNLKHTVKLSTDLPTALLLLSPDLNGVKFDVLDCLAEGADKYEVFSAMNICRFRTK